MELNLNDKYYKILSYIEAEVKSENRKRIWIFREFLSSTANKKKKYLVQIMKKMNFNENGIVIEQNYDIFYNIFFDLALKIFQDKTNTKIIKISIKLDDLEIFEEKKNNNFLVFKIFFIGRKFY